MRPWPREFLKGSTRRILVGPLRKALPDQRPQVVPHERVRQLRFDLAGGAVNAEQRVEEMCRRLLANLVIEDFRFEIVEE